MFLALNRRCLGALLFAGTIFAPPGMAQDSPRISTTDVLRFAEIGIPDELGWNARSDVVEARSPDGLLSLIVVRHVDSQNDENVSRIFVYNWNAEQAPPLRELVKFASSGVYHPISKIRWLTNRSFVFAGARGTALPQAFRFDVARNKLTQLTSNRSPMVDFDVADTITAVTIQEPLPTFMDRNDCRNGPCLLSASEVEDLPFGAVGPLAPGRLEIFDRSGRQVRTVPSPAVENPLLLRCEARNAADVAPDGRYAIRVCRYRSAEGLPASWSAFSFNVRGAGKVSDVIAQGNPRAVKLAYLVDLHSGKQIPLYDLPIPYVRTFVPIWIEGGKKVLLPGVLQVPNRNGGDDGRLDSLSIVELDVETLHHRIVTSLPPQAAIESVELGVRDDFFLSIAPPESDTPSWWKLSNSGDQWQLSPATKGAQSFDLWLEVRQSFQDAPVLIRKDKLGRESIVLDPNPWLREHKGSERSILEWESAGQKWKGGLFLPPDYDPRKRYPLLIQTHGFDSSVFNLYGEARNFPGEAAAARGMIVLQVGERLSPGAIMTANELTQVQSGYESAIDKLVGEGKADPSRIGIIGWSRTGTYLAYTVVRSKYNFAASALVSSEIIDYYYYLMGGYAPELSGIYGSDHFGVGMENWLEQAPSFSIDRYHAPLLIFSDNPRPANLELYWALSRKSRAVEMWKDANFGTHDVLAPRSRRIMTEALTDWFDFWLNGHEVSDISKAEQYSRWGALRDRHGRAVSSERPPLLDWSSRPVENERSR